MSETCPVCGAASFWEIDRRAPVPVLLNRVYARAAEARAAPSGVLDLCGCGVCGFAWNRAFNPSLIVYDGDYENDQTHSPAFAAHIEARAKDVAAAAPDGGLDYLEIGCGQGVFIGEVARAAGARLRSATGFDPVWRGPGVRGPHGSRIHAVYFGPESARFLTRPPNVAASRHTIEHVPDPVAFLRAIRAALKPSSSTRLFIETPSLSWILEHQAMQDFFYEHCSIFTVGALRHALEISGFRVRRVDPVFGGQYLWAEAEAAPQVAPTPLADAAPARLSDGCRRFTATWREAVEAAKSRGDVAIWGAGAKGVTFALLVDPECRLIDHAIDINPQKQGRHLAGSGLVVLSPRDAAGRRARTIFVMNPNYLDEIRAIAAEAGVNAELVAVN